MRLVGLIVLYTGLALGANAALAAGPDLTPLLKGDMEKMVPAAAPAPLPEAALIDATDAPKSLADYKGKVMLVNFWATWCAPCRKELGTLDRLQGALGGERFAVVTIATGPNPVPAMQKLFADEKVTHLPLLRDPDQAFARQMGVLALPVSVLVDADGREIGRLMGDAAWDSPEALALVKAVTGADQ
ncbi:MAG: TlpA family protein disulfide reductase [Proteobacteria bacterium]|nr:TlpA family protein disulfide reductase [Pseudomonadota bacterium]MBS0571754.1 TlpA family protein disulfide reductase [Pseudomonadota bacterium]